MNISLYYNASENNRLDKSLTLISSLTGTLKDEEVSILRPTILVGSEDVLKSNYCYIEDFNRYYFIKNVNIHRQGLYILELEVDVLTTYKDQIREQTGIISRQENLYNLYLTDSAFKLYSNMQMQIKKFPQGFKDECVNVLITCGGIDDIPDSTEV